jgi:hypothetical protein
VFRNLAGMVGCGMVSLLMESCMRAMFGLVLMATATAALAQGQGGYAPGVPGAETVRMSSEERARARAMHQTNDMSHGPVSIDKSGKSFEGGRTCGEGVQGTIDRNRGGSRIPCPIAH